MSPCWGFAVYSKMEQTLEKPAFTQSRDFLHDSRVVGRPLEKSAGARMASTSLRHRISTWLSQRAYLRSAGRPVCAQLAGLI